VATSSAAAFFIPAAFALVPIGLSQNAYAIGLVAVMACVVFVAALLRVRCVIASEGIEVVNLWRTYFVPWRAILRTEEAQGWLGGAFFLSSFEPLRIRTVDGRKVIVQASMLDDKRLIASAIEAGRSGAR